MVLLPIEDRSPGTIAECTTSSERRESDDTAFEFETASGANEDHENS